MIWPQIPIKSMVRSRSKVRWLKQPYKWKTADAPQVNVLVLRKMANDIESNHPAPSLYNTMYRINTKQVENGVKWWVLLTVQDLHSALEERVWIAGIDTHFENLAQ